MISYMFSETLNPTHLLTCCSLYVSLVLHVYCSIIIRGVMWPETLVLWWDRYQTNLYVGLSLFVLHLRSWSWFWHYGSRLINSYDSYNLAMLPALFRGVVNNFPMLIRSRTEPATSKSRAPCLGHCSTTVFITNFSLWFLPERDYVTFGSLLSQFRLSVCLSSVCRL